MKQGGLLFQDGSGTFGGSLYGRVYSAPVPRMVTGWEGNLLELSSAAGDQPAAGAPASHDIPHDIPTVPTEALHVVHSRLPVSLRI